MTYLRRNVAYKLFCFLAGASGAKLDASETQSGVESLISRFLEGFAGASGAKLEVSGAALR